MELTPEEKNTRQYYDTNFEKWFDSHSMTNFWATELDFFHELLPKGKILEVGSGGGRDAKELAAKGYEYVGTDISEGALEVARMNNPELSFAQQGIYDLDLKEKPFDGFWAAAVLLHVPKEKINFALQKIADNLKKDAVGFISLKEGEGEEVKKDDQGERYFAYWLEKEFSEILKDNGFEVLKVSRKKMNEETTWLVFFVKKT